MTDSTTSWLHPKPGTFTVNTVRSLLTQPFAFELMLQSLVKGAEGTSLALVLLGQGWSHYSAVATKCGISSLKSRREEGTITVVDLFDETAGDDHSGFFSDPCEVGQIDTLQWGKLVKAINAQVTKLPSNSVLLIDDLSVLLSYIAEPALIYSFVRRLRQSLKRKQCSLFIGTYFLEEDEAATVLVTSLLYECDTWLDCDRPKSGYSQTINGIAKCHTKQQAAEGGSSTSVVEMNYRLSNRTVIFKRI